jgi:hypothetical protein
MRKGYPSKLQRSVVGYASAGFAEAVKMPRAEALRALQKRGWSVKENRPQDTGESSNLIERRLIVDTCFQKGIKEVG